MGKKPNILLITSDQQHHDTIGKFNSKIQTPSLDRLCNEGMNFTRAYCPSPVCTPSRASIITGQYPSSHGAWTIGVKLEETVETIGELLYKNGYSTGLIGKAHFQPLTSVPGQESIEGQPTLRDLEFWKNFKGPWYGFEHIELARNHADESHVGQHYAIWMEQNGLSDWKEYFQPVPGETSKYAPPIAREYDYWARPDRVWQLDEKHHYTNWTAERSIEFLDQQKDDKPFFLWTSFQDPHPPYVLSDPWASMYNPSDMSPGTLKEGEHDLNPPHFGKTQTTNPDFENWHSPFNAHGCMSHLYPMEELKKDMAIYYGMISFMDKNIGKIINKLDQIGELDNTIIIFTTDHGHFIGQHGLIAKGPFHYEDMLRLPFIVRWPGKVPQNSSSSSLLSLVDLAPTFLKVAGIDIPTQMQGVDQTDVFYGNEESIRSHIFVENRHNPKMPHLKTYINENYKISIYREANYGELFDLKNDPNEYNNLWDNTNAQTLKKELLFKFAQATLKDETSKMKRVSGA